MTPKQYTGTGMFAQYRDMTLEDVKVTDDNEEAVNIVGGRIDVLPTVPHQGLLLIGSPGTGKTMLLNLYAKAAAEARVRTRVVTLTTYIETLRMQMSNQRLFERSADPEMYTQICETDQFLRNMRRNYKLLILDDVGKEYRTDSGWSAYQFDYLIRDRFNRGLTTCMTSNLELDRWSMFYADSMRSFLKEAFQIVVVPGGDWRDSDGKR